ncbi:MAG: dTDP-4-dehydrorhamnose reductase [Patescibacteria group bacterium]|jgi:dTDP-4-dehydrorhamnose reductase
MKFLLTGARGMLGKDLARVIDEAGYTLRKTDRKELDITKREETMAAIKEWRPDVIINAAAYNFVDKVEEEALYPLAYAINAEGPRHLAEAAREIGARFVHYSTDYVFAGDKPEGYCEDDLPAPISKYGETKAAGERFVQEMGGEYFLCRLSKIFGEPGLSEECKESFVALMLRLAKEKPELTVVNEEVGSPSYTVDIARATLNMILEHQKSGIYHLVNEGPGVTWYEFAQEIFSLAHVGTPFHPCTSAEFPKPAKRPKFASLRNTKLPVLRDRREALREFLTRTTVRTNLS